jgi:hypothetical protein
VRVGQRPVVPLVRAASYARGRARHPSRSPQPPPSPTNRGGGPGGQVRVSCPRPVGFRRVVEVAQVVKQAVRAIRAGAVGVTGRAAVTAQRLVPS